MKLYLLAAIAFTPFIAKADVTPLNIVIETNSNYYVPAGKVALINFVSFGNGGSSTSSLRVFFGSNPTNSIYVATSDKLTPSSCFTTPLTFAAGTQLTNSSPHSIYVIGRLVSPEDLYAKVPAKMNNVATTETKLKAVVSTESSRPVKINVETSTDLETWQPASDAEVAKTATGKYSVTVNKDGESRKFVRAEAVNKPKS